MTITREQYVSMMKDGIYAALGKKRGDPLSDEDRQEVAKAFRHILDGQMLGLREPS
jgi:hypothetical protein